jgi:two-component system sensor histidine kinase KdpD
MSEYRRRTSEEVLRQIESLRRARHKIFIGAAAGVGKTYAMLLEAHSLRESGIDVVAGVIDTHGRPETAAMLEGIELLPPLRVPYNGMVREELDVAAVLRRQPDVVLVDELAHQNPPDLRHAKRYEDVQEILDQGINVHSTLNVQHLQSLNDIVAQVTGIRVRETVPDSVVADATELRLIDLAPEALVERLRQGKVYPPDQARRALDNFFRVGNLTALRELALRTVADEADSDLDDYMRLHHIKGPWHTKERVMVCITASPSGQVLIRRGYRMARRLKGDFLVVTVQTPNKTPSLKEAQTLDLNLRLAGELGAEIIRKEDIDVARCLVDIAKEVRATQIILGETSKTRWEEILRGSVIERILRETRDADVLIVANRVRK